jgi:hypothetical protein
VLDEFEVAIAGQVAPLNRQLIDHVAHDEQLVARVIEAFDRHDSTGTAMSDHDGVVVSLARADQSSLGQT